MIISMYVELKISGSKVYEIDLNMYDFLQCF